MNKKVVKKIGTTVITTGISLSLLKMPSFAANNKIPQTYARVATPLAIEESYSEEIQFNNQELYNIVNNIIGIITFENLDEITELKISTSLSNPDLSDLKYFPSLKKLTIENNVVNAEDLSEIKQLKSLELKDCTLYNTSSLPESLLTLYLNSTKVTDGILITPNKLNYLYLVTSTFNTLKISNPETLTLFHYNSYELLDLNSLKDCTNLERITLKRCPNVLNKQVLTTFQNTTTFTLDEHSTLWLDRETLKNIPLSNEDNKDHLLTVIDELDSITNSLISEGMTEEEKINAIIIYVLNQIDYDRSVYGKNEEAKQLAIYYNDYPISSAINDNYGVCVGYACLFEALANRAGIMNYQESSFIHVWNMVKLSEDSTYSAYDLTQLDVSYSLFKIYNQETGYYDKKIESKTPAISYIIKNDANDLYFYNFDYRKTNNEYYNQYITSLYEALPQPSVEELPQQSIVEISNSKEVLLISLTSFALLTTFFANYLFKKEVKKLQKK